MNNNLETKQTTLDFDVKAGDKKGTFVAYGNTFNKKDLAGDLTIEGAFGKCIKSWKEKGEFPQFLSQHGHKKNPIGIITGMEEDDNGLKFSGEFCLETQDGSEAHALVKMGALKRFSIGYQVIKEKMVAGINELHELYVKEISLVTFACNEDSLLQSVKSAVDNGENPMRLLQKFMQEHGLSKRQATAAINAIKTEAKIESSRELEINNIKQKIKSFDSSKFDLEIKSSGMSMQEYVSMVVCAVVDSIKSGYEDEDDVYFYCAAAYTDCIVMEINDYRTEPSCCSYVKVPYSVTDERNVMVGTPVSVTKITKWVTEDEREKIENSEKLDGDEPHHKDQPEDKSEEPEYITASDIKNWFDGNS